MGPLRKDLENQLNILKREMLGQAKNGTQLNITDNITKLANASSACSDKISQIIKVNSDTETTLTRMSVFQTKSSVKIDEIDSTLIRIKQNLEAIQAKNEHIASNQAENTKNLEIIQARKGHTDPNQAENTKKVTSIEANQTQIMGILSSLKDDKNTMRERLEISALVPRKEQLKILTCTKYHLAL
jgi:hypothetical protein